MRAFGLCSLAFFVAGLFSGCGTAIEASSDDAIELYETADGDDKADRPSLTVTPFDDDVSSKAGVYTRKIFKTALAYRQFFGHAPPPSVDFPREWVVFYAAGSKPTGGFSATVEKVALSNTGLSLKVTTRLATPGRACFVTFATTQPYALVKFYRPSPRPSLTLFYRDDVVNECGCAPVLCDLFCEHGFQNDEDGCEVCACAGPDRDVATGQCVRNGLDACETDADCTTGGCGGELCYNAAEGERFTTCDCARPTGPAGCGCVAGKCAWYN